MSADGQATAVVDAGIGRSATGAPVELPRYVEVETSRRCNRTCGWCPNGEHAVRRRQELMDWTLFRRIVDELGALGYGGWLAFHNYNEPLLNRRLLDEIGYVCATVPGARPAIYSNGDVLTRELFERLVSSEVAYIRVTRYPHTAVASGRRRRVERPCPVPALLRTARRISESLVPLAIPYGDGAVRTNAAGRFDANPHLTTMVDGQSCSTAARPA